MNKLFLTTGILSLFLVGCQSNEVPPVEIQNNPSTNTDSGVEIQQGQPSESGDSTSDLITEAEAKSIALQHAGVSENDVTFVKVNLDYDDGIQEYEVEFYVGNMEYDYEIHGVTGEIRSFDNEMESSRGNSGNNSSNSTNNGVDSTVITDAEAKRIALEHAGVSENDVTFVKVNLDFDDGIQEYEVEFYVDNMEYDYEIHASTGEIRSYDYEMEAPRGNSANSTTDSAVISEEEAKSIALNHAGVNESEVTFIKVNFDYDDGIPEYEVEFHLGNLEYDYEIHGNTGTIIDFEKDYD